MESAQSFAGSLSAREAGGCKEERLLRAVCEQVARKASQKYKTLREALRYVDSDHDGLIDKGDIRYFFRAYDFSEDVADRFFEWMNPAGNREIEYRDFERVMSRFVGSELPDSKLGTKGCSSASTREGTPSSWNSAGETNVDIDTEFKDTLQFIAKKSKEKFVDIRRAFRPVRASGNGIIRREDMRHFFRIFNFPQREADRFFDRLDVQAVGEVELARFMDLMRPYGAQGSHKPMNGWAKPGFAVELGTFPQQKSPQQKSTELAEGVSPPVGSTSNEENPQKELRKVMQRMGEKLPLKFKHARDAFRVLDLERNGRITREEMRGFFRGFGEAPEVADRVYVLLQDDALRGEVNFAAFMKHFDGILGPSFRQGKREPLVKGCDPFIEKELCAAAAILGERLLTKYQSISQAFRSVDLDKDGSVSRYEMRIFFRNFGMSFSSADKLFDALDVDKSESIEYDEFVAIFGPHLQTRSDPPVPAPQLRRLG
jgi:Ca2+-binding EF-hand superfamily protein